jgi:uncharacterized membrane protein
MASRLKTTPTDKSDPILRWASIILAILGTADAIYLLIYKYSSNDRMCLGNGGCATVNYSPYSEIYGVPVALLGILAYLAILAVLALEPHWKLTEEYGRLTVFGMGLVGVLFSAYLTYIEAYVIHAYCPFCVTSAILITVIFILAIIRLIKHSF